MGLAVPDVVGVVNMVASGSKSTRTGADGGGLVRVGSIETAGVM